MMDEQHSSYKKSWEGWMNKHPDLFTSVHRGRDRGQLEIVAKDVIQKLSLKKGDKFLDAGCGSGVFLSEIIKASHVNAVGVDFSVSHIKFAKQHFPHIKLVITPVEELPFRSDSFDKILTYSVMHCLNDWKKPLDEFLRVSKIGGRILLGDIPSIRHKYRMYLNSLIGLLSSIGDFKKLREKWNYVEEGSPWNWLNLDEIKKYVERRGSSCKILPQPRHRQFESITHNYRFDILIEK